MGRFVPARWSPNLAAAGPRRARAGGVYRAFQPDLLAGRPLSIDGRVAADIADAERAMAALDSAVSRDRGPHRLEVLARLLLRAEAVGSSRVEGLVVSARKLALADLDPALDPSGRALDVVGNIRALQNALALAAQAGAFATNDLRMIHRTLLAGTCDAVLGGVVRTEQNWIGGQTPLDAAFVPPPPDAVPALLADLCAYLSSDDHPPLVQAALAHAQFETIHPFADGNGRTGRALLQFVLRRRGLCARFVPPISLVLATRSKGYIAALTATRTEGVPGSASDLAGANSWLEFAADAARAACAQARAYETRIDGLVEHWEKRVREVHGALRADAAVWQLLTLLPAAPLVTVASASTLSGRSERALDAAFAQLVAAGVLKQVGGRVRYRLFEAVGVFDFVTGVERQLASPSSDTRREPPGRPVPARPRR